MKQNKRNISVHVDKHIIIISVFIIAVVIIIMISPLSGFIYSAKMMLLVPAGCLVFNVRVFTLAFGHSDLRTEVPFFHH